MLLICSTYSLHSLQLMPLQKFTLIAFLLCLLCCLHMQAFSQKKLIHGFVADSSTQLPVYNAAVSNEITKKTASTNEKGFFTITVSVGDLLFISAANYHFDTLKCLPPLRDTVFIFLNKLPNVLKTVTVTTKGYTKYQQDSLKRRETFYKDLGLKRTSVSTANDGAGLGINLDYFSKAQRDKRRAEKLFKAHEKDAYINYRFSIDTVALYTGLKNESLQNFMNLYTPSYDWLRAHTADEDVFFYINEKLKLYFNRK